MRPRLVPALLSLLLAGGFASAAVAQSRVDTATMLPVWNSQGQVEGALVLEPAGMPSEGKVRFGRTTLSTAFGLDTGESVGLLCKNTGIGNSISSLAAACNVAMLGGEDDSSQRFGTGMSLSHGSTKVGVNLGNGHYSLPAWMTPGTGGNAIHFEQNDLAVFGQKNIGREGFVTIGGTVARARLVPASELGTIPDQWNSRSLSVGGGYGAFSGSIIGRVVDVPGQPQWEGIGLGVTWHTPWSGQLTVGAENVITRGKNPFTPDGLPSDGGTVPYVRYEQDL